MTGGPAGDGATTEVGHIGPYRLLHRLGEGGMGVVHLGLDRAGRAVAIKVLRAHVAHDPDARARLTREVSSLRRVRHPLVAEVLDADVDGDQPYVVTRFVPGPGLDAVVKDEGALPAARLTVLGRGLSQALGAIHAAGVVHRDLKPGNVLVLDGQPVVIDFGIAHVADDVRLTSVGLVMGTPGYLSPEVIDGEPVGTATDWWGWAATLAFAASGRPPFGRGPMDVVIDRVRRGQCDLDGVDRRLQPLLVAALDVDPRRRPDADEVLNALDRYAAGEDTTLALRSAAPVTRAVPVTRSTGAPSRAAAPPHESVHPSAHGQALPLLPFGVEPPPGSVQARPAPRARRNGTLAAVLAALVGAAVAWPTATAAVAALLMVLARTVERTGAAMTRRRWERGGRRTDVLVGAVSVPWHLLGALLATLLACVLPAVLGVATAFSAGLLVTGASGSPRPTSPPALAAGAVVALLTAWWGPGGSALRRGSRVVVRATVPASAAVVVILALLAVAAGSVVAAVQLGHPVWWPIRTLPWGLRLP